MDKKPSADQLRQALSALKSKPEAFQKIQDAAIAVRASLKSEMSSSEEITSTPKPVSRLDLLLLKSIPPTADELERRRLAVEDLKERLSSHPLFAAKAKDNPRYWEILQSSQINL